MALFSEVKRRLRAARIAARDALDTFIVSYLDQVHPAPPYVPPTEEQIRRHMEDHRELLVVIGDDHRIHMLAHQDLLFGKRH